MRHTRPLQGGLPGHTGEPSGCSPAGGAWKGPASAPLSAPGRAGGSPHASSHECCSSSYAVQCNLLLTCWSTYTWWLAAIFLLPSPDDYPGVGVWGLQRSLCWDMTVFMKAANKPVMHTQLTAARLELCHGDKMPSKSKVITRRLM